MTVQEWQVIVLEDDTSLSLGELSLGCGLAREVLCDLVTEGALHPTGASPLVWRFDVAQYRRAQRAARLLRDLQLNLAGVALVLELLDEIVALRARLPPERGS